MHLIPTKHLNPRKRFFRGLITRTLTRVNLIIHQTRDVCSEDDTNQAQKQTRLLSGPKPAIQIGSGSFKAQTDPEQTQIERESDQRNTGNKKSWKPKEERLCDVSVSYNAVLVTFVMKRVELK